MTWKRSRSADRVRPTRKPKWQHFGYTDEKPETTIDEIRRQCGLLAQQGLAESLQRLEAQYRPKPASRSSSFRRKS